MHILHIGHIILHITGRKLRQLGPKLHIACIFCILFCMLFCISGTCIFCILICIFCIFFCIYICIFAPSKSGPGWDDAGPFKFTGKFVELAGSESLTPGHRGPQTASSSSGILYTWHKRVHTCLYGVHDMYVLCYSMYISYTPYRHIHTFLEIYEHVHTFWNIYKHVCTWYVHVDKYSGINMYVHRSDMYVHVYTIINQF